MSTVEALLIAARSIHFGAAMVLFGEMLFAGFFVAGEASGASTAAGRGRRSASSGMRLCRVVVAAWACVVISGACWLILVALQMSGRPLAALDRETLAAVLGSTVFGRAWLLRALLALALAGMWPALLASATRSRVRALLAVVISGALLASLAWSGHANDRVGLAGAMHHLSDSVHLLAAGAWLGGLAPLAALLRPARAPPDHRAFTDCADTVRRFGNGAALCVGALAMTGIVNACYLIPDPGSLLETTYGRLLLLKVCAFLLMLAIAAINRRRLTPALNPSNQGASAWTRAARSLRRNVVLEQALAAVVLLLVAALGVSPPPMRM